MALKHSRRTVRPAAFQPVTSVNIPDNQANGIRLLTPDDVSQFLGISRIQVIRQSRAGKIPHIRLNKVYRYRPESIHAWAAAQERAA
jgi:hypothetical protein